MYWAGRTPTPGGIPGTSLLPELALDPPTLILLELVTEDRPRPPELDPDAAETVAVSPYATLLELDPAVLVSAVELLYCDSEEPTVEAAGRYEFEFWLLPTPDLPL